MAYRQLTVILRPHRLDPLCDALVELGVSGITLTDVEGVGRQQGFSTLHSGVWYQSKSHPKVRLDVAMPETLIPQAISLVLSHARTGVEGDGKLWVIPMARAPVVVRTIQLDGEGSSMTDGEIDSCTDLLGERTDRC
ncbi:MAG: P-II family nitrogen regulator [Acidithiobacillus sp.]